ncbi:MAG: ROK family protein [Clostridia bacterium]
MCGISKKNTKRSLKDYNDCVFLCIGTGIGGAAFFGGKFIRPIRNAGFEFGHMVINKNGEQCNCGNKGCFEVYCSKKKFKEQMQKILGITEYVGAADLTKAVEENMNNDDVKNLLEEYVDNLALGIANIINILEPEAISIGGSMSHYEKLIFGRLKEKIYSGEYLFNKENPPKILTAQAGNDAGIVGATLIS